MHTTPQRALEQDSIGSKNKTMKKVVILKTSDTELANQLWNYISVYAYARERRADIVNYSFYEYGSRFAMPAPNFLFKLFFVLPFTKYEKRKQSLMRKIWRKFYNLYSNFIIWTRRDAVLVSADTGNNPTYLPPTNSNDNLKQIENSSDTIYLCGWLFRNPVGIEKYRTEILNYIRPKIDIENRISKKISGMRDAYKAVIGVHVRQGDYRTWQGGQYYIDPKRTRQILDEFLMAKDLQAPDTLFVITSDESIDPKIFDGLNIEISKSGAVDDLFLLSRTDTVIGSDSTFGDFAAYYGNIPHIVTTNDSVDWNYYREMTKYEMGKYVTWVHF